MSENYQPITVLSVVSKIFEKAVHEQLSEYLEKNELLTEFQFGYRTKRSTKLASALLCDDIRRMIDNRKLVGAVYINLTKEFDTIGHSILLNKLTAYGIEGKELDLLASYLFERSQIVSIGDSLSEPKPVYSGVPQGSILGPLLFIIFFIDFGDHLKHSKFVMYADDTVIYNAHKDKKVIEDLLEEDLKHINYYFDENELIINFKKWKTECMLLGTAKRIALTDRKLSVCYRDKAINFVHEYNYLGNILDSHLKFARTFTKTYKKVCGRLKLLHKLQKYMMQESSLRVHSMMIVPLLTYTGIVNLHLTCILSQKLKSIEKRAMKIINVTSLLSIEKMFYKESCILVRKCLEHRSCRNFQNYFEI